MFQRCIFCHAGMATNEVVERFPVGRRIAFDPGRGRLWAVCNECRRWNLAPIEERWEALEDLEKVTRDRGRLLSRTDNIALIRAGDVDIVRVGRDTRLVEEAWWRYGKELKERRSRHRKVNYIELGALLLMSATMGGAYWFYGGNMANEFLRWRQFGSTAWRGRLACPQCGHITTELPFKATKRLHLVDSPDEGMGLQMRCPKCRSGGDGHLQLGGLDGQHLLRRTLAWHHFSGASEKRVREATSVIDNVGSATEFARRLAASEVSVDSLRSKSNRTDAIALEIALNDDVERRLLELELHELEARWQEEEELASIVDGELTPLPVSEKLRRWINPSARPPAVDPESSD
jgi:hypothetical protein